MIKFLKSYNKFKEWKKFKIAKFGFDVRVFLWQLSKFFNMKRVEQVLLEELISFYDLNFWDEEAGGGRISEKLGVNIFKFPFTELHNDRFKEILDGTKIRRNVKRVGTVDATDLSYVNDYIYEAGTELETYSEYVARQKTSLKEME